MRNETPQEKENRIFHFYKNDLMRLGEKHGQLRMIVIEYVCSFPKIDPFKMAKELVFESFDIVFDDSSISIKENERKKRKVYGYCN